MGLGLGTRVPNTRKCDFYGPSQQEVDLASDRGTQESSALSRAPNFINS